MGNSITFTGLASGMDTAAWVDALVDIKKTRYNSLIQKQNEAAVQQKTISTVQSSFTSLRTSLEKITDAALGGSFDLFSKTKATSTNSEQVTATSKTGALKKSYELSVKQLASATKAMSKPSALSVQASTKMDTLSDEIKNLKDGETASFSVYINGEKSSIEVNKDDTIDSVLAKIKNLGNINATLTDGQISITGENQAKIVLGSNSDTVNIAKAFSLLENKETGAYESFETLSIATSKDKIAEVLGADAIGDFTIGGETFTIDENTTFDSLIKDINAKTKEAGVTAEFDKNKGQLVFTSTTNGSFNINISKGTSSFTDKMGYTEGTKLNSQELGSFAIYTLDGQTKMASSNTLTSDITGVENVTFNLKSVSTEEKPTTTINVGQDTDDLVSALKSFIENFNKTIDVVDEQTGADGTLHGESSLETLRNTIRTGVTSKQTGAGEFTLLAQIGISTGKASNDLSKSTDHLELDEKKLKEALEKNPQAVKELLVGGKNNKGILSSVEDTVDQSLKSTGYFTTRNNSLDKEKTSLGNSADAENRKIEAYKARLQAQFSNMETIISKMQGAYSSALSQMGLR